MSFAKQKTQPWLSEINDISFVDLLMIDLSLVFTDKSAFELKVVDGFVKERVERFAAYELFIAFKLLVLLVGRDLNEEDPMEIEASKFDLAYIKLDGEIGCMVNGAGLAMATMDIIKLYGSEPANFLDVGGGASKEKVTAAFKIILSDKNVKGILINIFGGIMKCDVIADGVIAAAKETKLSVPLVVRLAGTNFEQGKKILSKSGLKIIPAEDLSDAAKKIVDAIK